MRRPTIGAALTVLLALACYALLWIGWRTDFAPLTRADDAVLDFFHAYGAGRPGWIRAWNVFCLVFDPVTLRILALVPIGIELYRRNLRTAVFLVVTIEGSGLVTLLAKHLADRPRPETALVHAHGTSFPSGHALGDLVVVCALLIVYLPRVAPRWRAPLIAVGALLVVTVGLARVILNVHHPSDILAGWALGYAYLQTCRWLVPPTPAPPPFVVVNYDDDGQ